jgi:benzoyl-CoA reductase/2-hydroxyglutaryl-CoA dehydratase subunit BcrC/BadD/HgdB
MCHESIKRPLNVVKCFDNNDYIPYEHGNNIIAIFGGLEIFDSFENEILVLHRNVRLEVIKVIKPFL